METQVECETMNDAERACSHRIHYFIATELNGLPQGSDISLVAFSSLGSTLAWALAKTYAKPDAHRLVDEFAKVTHEMIDHDKAQVGNA